MEDGLGGYFVEVKAVEADDEGEWKCVATSLDNTKQFTMCDITVASELNFIFTLLYHF